MVYFKHMANTNYKYVGGLFEISVRTSCIVLQGISFQSLSTNLFKGSITVVASFHGRSNGLHEVYAIMLGGSRDMLPWIHNTK